VSKPLRWAAEPREKDFRAAASYLSLVLPEARAGRSWSGSARARTVHHQAKDLERASGMKLLPPDDPEVVSKPKKSRKRAPLTPVLLVRGALDARHPLVIADGFHRICAAYHVDRNAPIPCRSVDLD
jgi:hypothetical protein